jgi:hypothetical protein
MSSPGAGQNFDPQTLPASEARTVIRAKTVATRLTPEELGEVEAAAARDGKSLAEWLRELALKTARQRPADPMELLLSEVSATRYMLVKFQQRYVMSHRNCRIEAAPHQIPTV